MKRPLVMLAATAGWLAGCGDGGNTGDCTIDTDCPAGYYCRSGDCVHDCTYDQECPEGFRCTARGRCERGCTKTNGGIEACDGVDNDCDGETDEGLLNRCGACEPPDEDLIELCGDGVDNDCDGETDEGFERVGTPCQNGACTGDWVCTPDGRGEECNALEPADDDAHCDGVDEDCDGETDEDAADRLCPLQQGVCAGTVDICLPHGAWSGCDYGQDYTEGSDTVCDTLDNDCDGETDEDAGFVLEAEAGPAATDGLDNNCNGLIDESGGVMVPAPLNPGMWIDAYETAVFENADCSGARYGLEPDDFPAGFPPEGDATVTLYACSLPGVVPSGYLSWYRAKWVCEAQGKRLCTAAEWTAGCTGGEARLYPYGITYHDGICNDPFSSAGSLLPTGDKQDCTNQAGTHDMSGNMGEWVQDWDPEYNECALTGGFFYACELCSRGTSCYPCDDDPDDQKDIEDGLDCIPSDCHEESFPRNDVRSYLGARCCYDGP